MSLINALRKFTVTGLALTILGTSSVFGATYGKVIGNTVNIRSGASTASNVVSKVNEGDALTLIGVDGDWFKVSSSNGDAYVTSEYVKVTQADGIVNSSNVNVRISPETSADIVGQLDEGAVLSVTGTNGDWYEVNYNDSRAYIYKDFLNGDMLGYISAASSNIDNSISSKANQICEFAKQFLGTPYVYGGTNLKTGVDCSGFTYSVYKNFGITLNRHSGDQLKNGTVVSKSELQPGDLVFFNAGGNSAISHVGMYIGNGQYIHSTDGKGSGVTITNLNSGYSLNTYVSACRVLK